jgi:hypothetical protein
VCGSHTGSLNWRVSDICKSAANMLTSDPDFLEKIEKITKVFGICGPLVTAGKSVVLFAKDQSLERKGRKTTQEISECLNRLHALEASSSTMGLELDPYRLQIIGDLQFLITELSALREKKLLSEAKRNKESTGIRRWLLLYRPEGLNGWVVQSFFFGTCAALVFNLITSFRNFSGDLGEVVLSTVIMGLWLLYARSVSLRLKDVGIIQRHAGIRELNSDLHWIRRALLLFKPTGVSAFIVHCFFYIFAFDAIALPVQEPMSTPLKVMLRVGLLLTAKIFQVDGLARRALKTKLAGAPRNINYEPAREGLASPREDGS